MEKLQIIDQQHDNEYINTCICYDDVNQCGNQYYHECLCVFRTLCKAKFHICICGNRFNPQHHPDIEQPNCLSEYHSCLCHKCHYNPCCNCNITTHESFCKNQDQDNQLINQKYIQYSSKIEKPQSYNSKYYEIEQDQGYCKCSLLSIRKSLPCEKHSDYKKLEYLLQYKLQIKRQKNLGKCGLCGQLAAYKVCKHQKLLCRNCVQSTFCYATDEYDCKICSKSFLLW